MIIRASKDHKEQLQDLSIEQRIHIGNLIRTMEKVAVHVSELGISIEGHTIEFNIGSKVLTFKIEGTTLWIILKPKV